jgi:hypothetical protein
MTIAKAVVLKGFKFSDTARANMQRVGVSTFDQSLARTAGRNGLVHLFDPADYNAATGMCADRAAANANISSVAGKYTAGVFSNGKPAIVPPAPGSNGGVATSFLKVETSFTVLLAYEITAAGYASGTLQSLLGSGSGASRLQVYKQGANNGNLVMAANGQDLTKGQYSSGAGRVAGLYVDAFSFDSATKSAGIVDVNGNVIGNTVTAFSIDPINGYSWAFGQVSGTIWDGKLGRIMIFDRAMHLAANLPALKDTMALLKSDYAL